MATRPRLALSTLGCPGDPVARVVAICRAGGAGAVELRCADGEPLSQVSGPSELADIRREFADADIEIAVVASYVEIGSSDAAVADLRWHIDAARALGARGVRVFGDARPDDRTRARAVTMLREVAPTAERAGVAVLLETHDAFLGGRAVASVLDEVGSPSVGAIWDVANPWRAGEAPEETLSSLLPWLRHVQLKDLATRDDLTPVLPGDGAIPLRRIVGLLEDAGYDGWLSLEWERAWHPGIPPVEVALARLSEVLR
jgi:sugar phosphate isomerase/epimerase